MRAVSTFGGFAVSQARPLKLRTKLAHSSYCSISRAWDTSTSTSTSPIITAFPSSLFSLFPCVPFFFFPLDIFHFFFLCFFFFAWALLVMVYPPVLYLVFVVILPIYFFFLEIFSRQGSSFFGACPVTAMYRFLAMPGQWVNVRTSEQRQRQLLYTCIHTGRSLRVIDYW